MNSLFKRIILSILVTGGVVNGAYIVVHAMQHDPMNVFVDVFVMFFAVLMALTVLDSEE